MQYVVEVKNNGRIQLPKLLRDELHLTDGSKLSIETETDFMKVRTVEQWLDSVRKMLKGNPAWEKLSVDDFLKERREEAQRESQEMGEDIS